MLSPGVLHSDYGLIIIIRNKQHMYVYICSRVYRNLPLVCNCFEFAIDFKITLSYAPL